MNYSLGSAQLAYDNRQPAEWEPEPDASIKCVEAIDKLKAAVRGFGNGNASAAHCAIEDAICHLLNNPDTAGCVRRMVGAS